MVRYQRYDFIKVQIQKQTQFQFFIRKMTEKEEIFRQISQQLIETTLKLEQLQQQKSTFSKSIRFQLNPFLQLLISQLQSPQITLEKFASYFRLDKNDLRQVIFKQNAKYSNLLIAKRLCEYLKISQQNLSKNYSTHFHSKERVDQFISIVREQIQILRATKEILKKNSANLDLIFQEIDFFNNNYIDCASFAEFFNHYSSRTSFSERGCLLMIMMIKGVSSSAVKLFLEDILDFIQDKNIDLSISKDITFNLDAPKSNLKFKQSTLNAQIQSIKQEQKIINLSISESISVKSLTCNQNQIIENDLSKIQNFIKERSLLNFASKGLSHLQIINSKSISLSQNNNTNTVKIEPNYQVQFEQAQNQDVSKLFGKSFLHQDPQNSKYLELKSFALSRSSQESFHHASERNQQFKKSTATPTSHHFQFSLIKSHSRNLTYLSRIKLADRNCPKFFQRFEGKSQKQQISNRSCLNRKFEVFEQKKVQFILSLKSIGEEFNKWYRISEQLITKNEKFTFMSGFNAIDTSEVNQVTFSQFKQFLKDCAIQKNNTKLQIFFTKFSVYKNETNSVKAYYKQNFIDKQSRVHNRRIESEQRVMRFSEFLKIFNLRRAASMMISCKKRQPPVRNKWDKKTIESFCTFFRILIDSCYQIQIGLANAKLLYTKMMKLQGDHTFQKIFRRQCISFDEIHKLFGLNEILLCQISQDDEYIYQQKLLKYLKVQKNHGTV